MVELIRQGYQVKKDPYIFTLTLQEAFKDAEHKQVQETINAFFDMFNIKVNTNGLFGVKEKAKEKEKEKEKEKKPDSNVLHWNNTMPAESETTAHKGRVLWGTLAKIPKPKERQYAIIHELPTEFTIDIYADYFVKRAFSEDRLVNRDTDKGIIEYETRLRNNIYHDIEALKNAKPPRVEEILVNGHSTKPKRYRVIDYTPENRSEFLLSKLIEENKVRLEG